MLERVWRKGNPLALLVRCKLIQPLWRILRKLKIELPYDPAITLPDIYPEKSIIQKETCTTMFIAALFTIVRTWKQHIEQDKQWGKRRRREEEKKKKGEKREHKGSYYSILTEVLSIC